MQLRDTMQQEWYVCVLSRRDTVRTFPLNSFLHFVIPCSEQQFQTSAATDTISRKHTVRSQCLFHLRAHVQFCDHTVPTR